MKLRTADAGDWTGEAPARRGGWMRTAGLGVLALGAAAALALGAGFLVFVADVARTEQRPSARADGIVALTGGAQRIEDAIDLLAGGYGRRLLISGVNERTSRDEIARLNPGQHHLIACCVDLDYRARNTIGNAIETRRWMRDNGFRSVAVVTSNYHMPRTLLELDHALAANDRIVPHPVVPEGFDFSAWWRHPSAARLLASEYVKFLVAWMRIRIETDPEGSRAAYLMSRGHPVKVAGPLER
ncbi:YdcF family protein [Methylobacterium oryzihabitans]|uniref:YdcF family protein n=1 Tax=Methylobacterium oryzihabitans TaxID=2499852 RepID=A0A3S3U570_9HYPH|nr:YdcF family protein [Methylobacterium oryzihabitans]RVU15850.1 YdcF family protein [Methylobacterium oryzihabitans]